MTSYSDDHPVRRIPRSCCFAVALVPAWAQGAATPNDGSVLPFPPAPSASVAAPTLQDSKHQRRVETSHLPKDAPNILIILLDDVGFGLARHLWRRDPHADAERSPMRASATTPSTPRRSARRRARRC